MRSAISSDGTDGDIYDGVIDPGDIPGNSIASHIGDLLLLICSGKRMLVTSEKLSVWLYMCT
jgi:hypothetical protein